MIPKGNQSFVFILIAFLESMPDQPKIWKHPLLPTLHQLGPQKIFLASMIKVVMDALVNLLCFERSPMCLMDLAIPKNVHLKN